MVISVLISSVLGILSGLGVGGGSLLMLWLTLVCGMEFTSAKCINLLFFLPAAAISCFYMRKQLLPNIRYVLTAAISGCTAAVLFSHFSRSWDIAWLKKIYGILLILTAIREFRVSMSKKQ